MKTVGFVVLVAVAFTTSAAAQNVNINTPMINIGDSYFEQFGINWGFQFGGPGGSLFFNNGGNTALPPFGGFDPNSGARLGFGNNNFFFNLHAAEGSSRSLVAGSPSLTLTNGVPGSFSDVFQRPFVTGFIPVVGTPSYPLHEKIQQLRAQQAAPPTSAAADSEPGLSIGGSPPCDSSSATRGDLSLAAIRQQLEREDAAQLAEAQKLVEHGEACERSGKTGAAKIFYRQAAALADDTLRIDLEARIERLSK